MASPITSGGPAPSPAQRSTGPYAILNVVRDGTAPSELFPGPGPSPNTVLLEPEDGPDVRVVTCHILRVMAPDGPGRPPRQLLKVDKINASVIVSDCRVAVACTNYDNGRRMTGIMPLAVVVSLPVNAISKARAKKQHAGNMMVGQVRYAWLATVGYSHKTGPLSQDKLRLGVVMPGGGLSLLLDIVMPGFPTGEVARDVVQRAARYQLTHFGQEMTPEQRQRVENLRHAVPLAPQPGGLATYFLREVPSALIPTYKGLA